MKHGVRLSGGVLSVLSLLTACGGGGDVASTAVAKEPLSTINYQSVTTAVVDSVAGSDSLTDSLELVTAANVDSGSASLPATTQPDTLVRYALSQVRQFNTAKRVRSQSVSYENVTCHSGSLSVVVNDADNSNDASSGDILTIQAFSCEAEAGLPVVSGEMTLVLGQVSFDYYGDLISGSMTMTLVNFGSSDVSFNGSAVVALSSNAVSLDFNNLVASGGSTGRTLNYKMTVYSNGTASIAGPIEVDGSVYTLSTPVLVTSGTVNPTAGTVRIADGHGNRVDVVLSPTGYTGSLFLKGDEVVDESVAFGW